VPAVPAAVVAAPPPPAPKTVVAKPAAKPPATKTAAPARPAKPAQRTAAAPEGLCANRTQFAYLYCMQEACARPAQRNNAQCVALRRSGDIR